ncbi:MAG: hypothetical protein L6R39_003919 [Caloplaca ligustica]|nr:MAG: hypothetical protein L6R39_003919 [Caloplaca ligustica]
MVLSTSFVTDCLAKEERLDPEDYLLIDPAGEKRLGFNLAEAMSRAKSHRGRLLQGMPTIYCTEQVKGGFDTYKAIIESNGGKCLLYKARAGSATASKGLGQDDEHGNITEDSPGYIYLLSGISPAEVVLWPKFRSMVQGVGRRPRIVEPEWMLDTALRQELRWNDQYELTEERANNMNNDVAE